MDTLINEVAIYLRKSRGEGEEDLKKHKTELVELAEKNGWRYVVYSEIGSAETIEYRPKMRELLSDVRDDMYDAVLVIDYDRLGRGDMKDQAEIKDAFSKSQTLIITPSKVYDLSNESDDMLSDFLSVMARFEYKQIKKRLSRGKKIGAKLGNWTNGTPPFPYYYDRETKRLKVDREKNKLYQRIKEQVLAGVPLYRIAIELNREGYRTNRGKLWSENAIYRLVTSEVHLGWICYGKTQGSGHKNKPSKPLKKMPRSEWVIVKNCHEAVKTEEEHSRILERLQRNRKIPKKSRSGTNILNGLVRCGRCGYVRSFTVRKNKKEGEHHIIKKCQRNDGFGNICGDRGIKVSVILPEIRKEIEAYIDRLEKYSEEHSSKETERLKERLEGLEAHKKKLEASLDKIRDLYEMGDYTRDEFIERRDKRKAEIAEVEAEIEEIKHTLNSAEQLTNEERLTNAKRLEQLWDKDPEVINQALKNVINVIYFSREGDNVCIEIDFK